MQLWVVLVVNRPQLSVSRLTMHVMFQNVLLLLLFVVGVHVQNVLFWSHSPSRWVCMVSNWVVGKPTMGRVCKMGNRCNVATSSNSNRIITSLVASQWLQALI